MSFICGSWSYCTVVVIFCLTIIIVSIRIIFLFDLTVVHLF